MVDFHHNIDIYELDFVILCAVFTVKYDGEALA